MTGCPFQAYHMNALACQVKLVESKQAPKCCPWQFILVHAAPCKRGCMSTTASGADASFRSTLSSVGSSVAHPHTPNGGTEHPVFNSHTTHSEFIPIIDEDAEVSTSRAQQIQMLHNAIPLYSFRFG